MNLVKSPLIKVFDEEFNRDIWFKCDFELPTGSFKYREAYELWRVLKANPQIKHVITTSSGNSAHAFAELERRMHGLVKITCFWWGNGETREGANLAAYKL
jgi:threonine dehydratase